MGTNSNQTSLACEETMEEIEHECDMTLSQFKRYVAGYNAKPSIDPCDTEEGVRFTDELGWHINEHLVFNKYFVASTSAYLRAMHGSYASDMMINVMDSLEKVYWSFVSFYVREGEQHKNCCYGCSKSIGCELVKITFKNGEAKDEAIRTVITMFQKEDNYCAKCGTSLFVLGYERLIINIS